MVKSRALNPPPVVNHNLLLGLQILGIGVLIASLLITAIVWFLPADVFKNWAYEWSEMDDFRRFEAIGQAEFACWVTRVIAPLIGIVAWRVLRRLPWNAALIADSFAGVWRATKIDGNMGMLPRWQSFLFRSFCLLWIVITLGHDWQALKDCATNWAYFQFRSGAQVLPNISDSNRAVIRYLLQVTPPGSRIFVASDQKLYFLSYYLLPRRLYHKFHPASEFVIPQAHQQRRMEAYQLAEIDRETIARVAPDYILEYFEQPDFVDRTRLHDDQTWLAFFRYDEGNPAAEPGYLVCLRRVETDGRP